MSIINEKQSYLNELCKKFNVAQLYVFGSVAKEKATKSSDVDLLVYFENIPLLEYADNYFDFMYALENLFSRKIDLVSGKALKNPYFISEIENTKKLVYDSKH